MLKSSIAEVVETVKYIQQENQVKLSNIIIDEDGVGAELKTFYAA